MNDDNQHEFEWVFWVGHTSIYKARYLPLTQKLKECFRCSVTRHAITIDFDEPVIFNLKDVSGCLVVPGSFEVPRVMVSLNVKGKPKPVVLYFVNPINPFGYGGDGDYSEAKSFADVINHFVFGERFDVPPNPFIRQLSRKKLPIPEIVFADKYLSPLSYAKLTKKPVTKRDIIISILIVLLGIGIIILIALVADYLSH